MSSRSKKWIILAVCILLIAIFAVRLANKRALFRQVGSNDMEVRIEATRALLEKGIIPKSLPAQKVIIRSKITQALAQIGGDRATETLIALLNDFEAAPRRWASNALVEVGAPALPALSEVLLKGSERSKKGAVDALGRMGSEAIPYLRVLMDHPSAQAHACTALGMIGAADKSQAALTKAAFRPLVQAIPNPDIDLANLAIPVLGDQRVGSAVDELREALANGAVRQSAIVALGDIADPSATTDLIPFLEHEDIGICTVTARALGQIGDARAAAPLAATLDERNANYRSALILALQRIGAPAAPHLAAQLDSPDVYVRRAAAHSMIGAGVANTLPQLRRAALEDEDIEVRAAATRAIGWPGNRAGIPIILQALRDEEGAVVDAGVSALADIGAAAVPTLISLFDDGDPTWSLFASRAFSEMGESGLPYLRNALDSRNRDVRMWAAITLADMGDREAIPKMQALYESSEGNFRVVLSRGLSQLGAAIPTPN